MNHIPDSATIVDVRTAAEYATGHFPQAVNIPLDEMQQRLDEFRHMQPPIVLYCRSGARSRMAAALLQHQGIREVYDGGGLEDMAQAGGITVL